MAEYGVPTTAAPPEQVENSERLPLNSPLVPSIIVGLSLVTVLFFQLTEMPFPAAANVASFSLAMAGLVLVLLWWALFYCPSPLFRWLPVGMLVAGVAAFFAYYRIESFDGNLRPTFVPYWETKADYHLAIEAPAVAAPPAVSLEQVAWQPTEFDSPGFLGANRTGVVRGIALNSDWQTHPPRALWRHEVGAGWASFAVVGQRAVTQEQRGPVEAITCYDLSTGALVWQHADPLRYDSVIAGDGPRATPTIDRGQVFAVGAHGRLNCLDAVTGQVRWSREILAENGGEIPLYGYSCSPLVLDQAVVVSGGGKGCSLIAYQRDTGQPLWTEGDEPCSYVSPSLRTVCGQSVILNINEKVLAAWNPQTGQRLWQHPWPGPSSAAANVSQPVVLPGDRILLSKGYAAGAELVQVRRADDGAWTTETLWRSKQLKTKFTNVVIHGDYAYGLDEGILTCIKLEDGQRQWKQGRYGHGQVLLVGDVLVVQTESGSVVLVAAEPLAARELAQLEALQEKTWNNPVVAGKYLLVRNAREAICYELRLLEQGR